MNGFRRFMNGRYGGDQLGRFFSFVALALIIVNIFVNSLIILIIVGIIIAINFFRMFSRDIYRRSEENSKFLSFVYTIKHKFTQSKNRAKDRDHCYFTCPRCKKKLRVPKGKGMISIHCPQCGMDFIKKT